MEGSERNVFSQKYKKCRNMLCKYCFNRIIETFSCSSTFIFHLISLFWFHRSPFQEAGVLSTAMYQSIADMGRAGNHLKFFNTSTWDSIPHQYRYIIPAKARLIFNAKRKCEYLDGHTGI